MQISAWLDAARYAPARIRFPDAWCGHLAFAYWVMRKNAPRYFVELGTHSGNSYLAFCQGVDEHNLQTKCFAVDTWKGDEHAGRYNEEIFLDLKAYHDLRYSRFSTLLRKTFDDAVFDFEDGSIELLHIDGLHTYEAVRHDFETWLPKLAKGALVLFHDTQVRERGFGVWQYWSELCSQYPYHLEFTHSNGLGVLQVNPDKHAIHSWLEPGSDEQSIVIDYFEALGRHSLTHYQVYIKDRDLERTLAERDALAAERDAFAANRVALATERDALAANRVALAAERDALAANRVALAAERDALAANKVDVAPDKDTLTNQLYRVTAERDYAQSRVSGMLRSTSWRLTAPLRFVGHLLRGDMKTAGRVIVKAVKILAGLLPRRVRAALKRYAHHFLIASGLRSHTSASLKAIGAIVKQRNEATASPNFIDPLTAAIPKNLPRIDIGVVTYNSARWIAAFVESLISVDYPKSLLTVRFVDNSSTDDTLEKAEAAVAKLRDAGASAEIMVRPNNGYGAGHNAAIKAGDAPYVLVTNVDLTFEKEALSRIVATAVADIPAVASWELRQKPYEHPKFYDPVTGLTNWSSHACVLLRRSALEQVGAYDETLFMYGEDVELSYRLRRGGFLLRYCPSAVVLHYSYSSANEIKPLQYIGSTFANLYIRLKYGNFLKILVIPFLAVKLLISPEVYKGSRADVVSMLAKLILAAPKALLSRRRSGAHFPFRYWDYDAARDGAFVEVSPLRGENPLVSVVTRTYPGREQFLRQALLSVAHQSYPAIEHIVVEDGGNTFKESVDNIAVITGRNIRHIPLAKVGRSAAGNAGLAASTGRWCLFLDDDDLLFGDHIEVLVDALMRQEKPVAAAYSLAWEVQTELVTDPLERYVEVSHDVVPSHRQPFDQALLAKINYLPIQSVLFDRRLFLERGGFEEDMEALEDWVLWRTYAHDNEFVYVPKVTSVFRTPAPGALRQRREKVLEDAYNLALRRAIDRTSVK